MFNMFRPKKKSPQQLDDEIKQSLRRRQEDYARADFEQAARVREESSRMSPAERRQLILDRAADIGLDFVNYDRKDDEKLGRGHIEDAIASGEISADEIVRTMANSVRKHLSQSRRSPRRTRG